MFRCDFSAAYFWIGLKGSAASTPDKNGQKIPDEKGRLLFISIYEEREYLLQSKERFVNYYPIINNALILHVKMAFVGEPEPVV